MSDSQKFRIGWIGTGRMGTAMVERLLSAGQEVHVWNRTRAKAQPLADAGAVVVDGIGALSTRDIVFTTVAADDDLRAVATTLLDQDSAPAYLVDSSTVSAGTSDEVRQAARARGTTLLAAPVSGNPKVVRAGRLSVAVSGPPDAYQAVVPVLSLLGAVTYVGEGDRARFVKLAHNILLGCVTEALAEVTVLAERNGVPRATFLEFINSSVLGSVFTRYKSSALVHLDLTPTFTTRLLRKDFDLGLAAARAMEVPLPVAALTHQLVQEAVGHGHGEEDFAALLVERALAAGVALSPEDVPVDDGLPPA